MQVHKFFYQSIEIIRAIANRRAMPITLDVDPVAGSCQSKCPNCTFPSSTKQLLDFNLYLETLKEFKQLGGKAVTFTGGGEPLLHPQFCEMVEKAREYGLAVGLITNGLALTKDKCEKILPHLNWIRFSVDAGTAETYKTTHGLRPRSFQSLISNMKYACGLKNKLDLKTTIGASYLIEMFDEADVRTIIQLGKNIGLDYVNFKPMQISDPKTVGGWSYRLEELTKAKDFFDAFENYGENFRVYFTRFSPQMFKPGSIEYRESPVCFGQYASLSLGADGRIYICCHKKYGKDGEIGDLNVESLEEILKKESEARNINPINSCLQACKFEGLNETIYRILNGKKPDKVMAKFHRLAQRYLKDRNDNDFL